jgi:hypothetical protein
LNFYWKKSFSIESIFREFKLNRNQLEMLIQVLKTWPLISSISNTKAVIKGNNNSMLDSMLAVIQALHKTPTRIGESSVKLKSNFLSFVYDLI